MTYYITFTGYATAFVIFTTEILFRFINSRLESHYHWGSHGVGRTPNGQQFKPVKWFWHKSRTESAKKLLEGSHHSNITPPPPYQSIFSSKERQENTSKKSWHNAVSFGANRNGDLAVLKPVVADSQYGGEGITSTGLRKFVNGREYMVYRTSDGENQLVPVRAPSAALFQYSYTE